MAEEHHRIETGRRLVAEQQFGIHDDGPRQGRPLGHAARQFGRHQIAEPGRLTTSSLRRAMISRVFFIEVGMFPQRQHDVLGDRHRTEQGAALEGDAHAAAQFDHLHRRLLGQIAAEQTDMPLGRLQQAEQMVEQRASCPTPSHP